MSNTSNYGFEQTARLCAIGEIDRELRRVEDKVDCAIRSLGRPSGKPGCGGWDKPPCGCSEELEQIWMALRERYSNEEIDRLILQYIREHDGDLHAHPDVLRELENLCRELDQKANMGPLEIFDLILEDDLTMLGACYYYKNPFEIVTIHAEIIASSVNGFKDGGVVAELPVGFRPVFGVSTQCTLSRDGQIAAGAASIQPDGAIVLSTPFIDIRPNATIIDCSFPATAIGC